MKQEASLINYLNSNELIKCFEIYHNKKEVYIMLELMEQGSLRSIVSHYQRQLSEDFCRYCLYKVALGLRKMHQNRVLHRDIKSDNILYSVEHGDVKISDLGFACSLSEQQRLRKTRLGTSNWVAPEIANNIQYN